MQDLLNRMVATVRYNIIAPEKGSRAIHGAAAMLGLQLAGDLPETAILVSGMRHKAQKKDVIEAFKEFGEIEDAAVAPNSKGFGKSYPGWLAKALLNLTYYGQYHLCTLISVRKTCSLQVLYDLHHQRLCNAQWNDIAQIR